METLQQTIKNQIKESMIAKDATRLSVLRGLSSAITNDLVDKGRTPQGELTDEEVLALIRRQVKQRKDAITQFTDGGRADLAESEATELVYLEAYLPQMMSLEEVQSFIQAKKDSLENPDKNTLIKEVMKELKGKAEGLMVKEVIDGLYQ